MAEFCLDCLNKLDGTHYTKWDVKLSWGVDFCEECEQMKRVVICMRTPENSILHRILRK